MKFNEKKSPNTSIKNHSMRAVGRDLDEIDDPSEDVKSFRDALAGEGLALPKDFTPGNEYRIPAKGKSTANTSAICFMSEDCSRAKVYDFTTTTHWTWSRISPLRLIRRTPREAGLRPTAILTAQQQKDQTFASNRAADLLATATRAEAHPYLEKKGVEGHGIKTDGKNLLIPIRDVARELHSLQTIDVDGEKRFLKGGRKKGCFYRMGKFDGLTPVVICEGFATGASIRESTGYTVAVAFDAGNLQPVASAIHAMYPDAKIIFAADDDYANEVNTGIAKANVAAQAVNGLVATPDFGANRPDGATDFNDLHSHLGIDAVKRCIDAAALPEEEGWPELQQLTVQYKALPYPIEALPLGLRRAVEEVAGFIQAPVPLTATSALATLSLSIQALFDVQRAEKLSGPSGLYFLAIADSGERKTSNDKLFTDVIREYESQKREDAKPFIAAYKADHEAWLAKCAGLKDTIKAYAKKGRSCDSQEQALIELYANEPNAPKVPRIIYADATPEALSNALASKWPSGAVISNEAGSVFGSHAMSPDSVMRTLAMFNQLWDGAKFTIDRKSSESFAVSGARLTMALQVQEETVRAFLTNTKGLARGSGFLARFLICWPVSTQGFRPFAEPPLNFPSLLRFSTRIKEILNQSLPLASDGSLSPQMLTLSTEAKAVWVKFHNSIESKLKDGGKLRDLRDVGSKSAENAVRLAALFHVFSGAQGAIRAETMEAAAQIVFWHLSEARRFLGEMAMPASLRGPYALEKWMFSYCRQTGTDSIPTRVIQQRGPGALRDGEQLTKAALMLTELGRARVVRDGKKKLIQIRRELLLPPTINKEPLQN